jgi:hypothetical protein
MSLRHPARRGKMTQGLGEQTFEQMWATGETDRA